MAFKRLRVERSPLLVWFGVIVMVFTFAGAQASSGAKFWRLQYVEPIAFFYLALMLLGAYCVFRGLYGEWWRVVAIDLDARALKTCEDEVVALDTLGALTIDNTELRAAGAKTPVYRSSPADVARIKAMLEDLVRPDGPRQLYRLHRLAFDRSISLLTFTLLGFATLVGVTLAESHTTLRELSYEPEYKLMLLVGYAVAFMWFRRALFGSFRKNQLFVDPAAGVLQLEDGTFVRLDELGELSIVERADPYRGSRRTRIINYDLRAANLSAIVFSDFWHKRNTQKRLDALATAILQFKLRRALEAPQVEGDAFRSGLDPADEAKRIAGDSPYKRPALMALTRDPDPTVRTRAAALL